MLHIRAPLRRFFYCKIERVACGRFYMIKKSLLFAVILLPLLFVSQGYAAGSELIEEGGHSAALTFLWIAVILLAAKLSGLVEKFGQPPVLGELIMGIVLGNLALAGISLFEPIKESAIIAFLAELGVVMLLFQIGLESNIHEMRMVGPRAFLVAAIGVVAPFLLGTYVIGPFLLPDLSFNAYLFLGAALTATSIGITARVFQDLGRVHDKEAQIVLEAAVIDDIMGLIILAVVSAIVTVGSISLGGVSWIIAKALIFLFGAIILGQIFAPSLGKAFSKISTGTGMKFTLAISLGLIFAFLADGVGLAPIVGAFAAGLVLDPVHFRFFKDPQIIEDVKKALSHTSKDVKQKILASMEPHAKRHVEDTIEPIAHLLVPIFFVMTGMAVNLEVFADPSLLLVALGVTLIAIIGKIVSGLVAGDVRKSIVGWGMVPRGEVGLIFAALGKSLGVISEEVFGILVIVVILTTLVVPPVLSFLLKREKPKTDILDLKHA